MSFSCYDCKTTYISMPIAHVNVEYVEDFYTILSFNN